MAQQRKAEGPDELQARLLKLKEDTYPLVVIFYITRRVLDELGVTEGLESSQINNLVLDSMVRCLNEQKAEGGEE